MTLIGSAWLGDSHASGYPGGMPDADAIRHEFVKANGLRFHAAACGEGDRLALCLHGYPMIDTPTLMLWGENDVALRKETTFGTDQHVSDLTLRYLPGVSHWVQQEAPETVNAMMEAWLTNQAVPEAGQVAQD